MKKALLLSITTLFLLLPSSVLSQTFDEIDLEELDVNQQQQEGIEITEDELDGLLSTACNNSSSRSKRAIARDLESEVDSSLSDERLDVLAETALEIKDLPSEELRALCQN